jgi:hypothetical protein
MINISLVKPLDLSLNAWKMLRESCVEKLKSAAITGFQVKMGILPVNKSLDRGIVGNTRINRKVAVVTPLIGTIFISLFLQDCAFFF